MTQLTALERELLNYVEQLAQSSAQSATAMLGLEERSTKQTNETLELLTDCVDFLSQSQKHSLDALKLWLREDASYEQVEKALANSLKQLQNAETRLKNSSR